MARQTHSKRNGANPGRRHVAATRWVIHTEALFLRTTMAPHGLFVHTPGLAPGLRGPPNADRTGAANYRYCEIIIPDLRKPHDVAPGSIGS